MMTLTSLTIIVWGLSKGFPGTKCNMEGVKLVHSPGVFFAHDTFELGLGVAINNSSSSHR